MKQPLETETATARSLRRIIILILSFALGLYLGGILVYQSIDEGASPRDGQQAETMDAENADR